MSEEMIKSLTAKESMIMGRGLEVRVLEVIELLMQTEASLKESDGRFPLLMMELEKIFFGLVELAEMNRKLGLEYTNRSEITQWRDRPEHYSNNRGLYKHEMRRVRRRLAIIREFLAVLKSKSVVAI